MKNIIIGAIIGIANIIPGVSGGTMAVVLGVYDRLISSISSLRKDFKSSAVFLGTILAGAGLGILLFANIIKYTLDNYFVATNLVFVGLIIGSIPLIITKTGKKKVKISEIIVFFITFFAMLYMNTNEIASNDVMIGYGLSTMLKLFFASVIASGAMIVPGISGSFIMLLLGTYTTVLHAVSNFDIIMLIPVGIGCICGILIFAKIIDKLFEKFSSQTYFAILGLMIGSIFMIFPSFVINIEFLAGILLSVISAGVVYFFSKK